MADSVEQDGRSVAVNEHPSGPTVGADLPVPDRALAVGAHPDDIEFGCGATLAKWAAGGCVLHHLVLTDGSKGTWDPERDPASLIAQRQSEQLAAARQLGGGDVTFLGWTDGELRNGTREQWEVSRVIRRFRPDVVLGHDPWRRYRLHPDHRNAGYLLTDALVAARDPLFFPDQDLAPHRPSALLLWEADVPDHVETCQGHEHEKVLALLEHRSQFESTMGISAVDSTADDLETTESFRAFRRRVLERLDRHGELAGGTRGEAFHVMVEL